MGDKEKITELISSLELAAHMADQIGTAVTHDHHFKISAALHLAHHNLSAFLSSSSTIPPAEKSLYSIEPMQLGEEEEEEKDEEIVEEERNSEVEMVEEKMKECFIRNKRAKRRLSPSSATAVESSAMEERNGGGNNGFDFDPYASKLRALDLIYQFHG